MKNFRHVVVIFLLSILLVACIKEATLPIRVETPTIVVDGNITNENAPYSVRLTLTGDFKYSNKVYNDNIEQGAIVQIIDSTAQQTYNLLPVLEDLGLYRGNDSNFVGKVGHKYSIYIKLPNETEFVSNAETLAAVPPIDKLYYQYTENAQNPQPYGHYIYVDTQDPKGLENYYRWEAYWYSIRRAVGSSTGGDSGCWQYFVKQGYDVQSDRNIDGNKIQQRQICYLPLYGPGSHLVEVSQYSLSANAYTYFSRLNDQYNRTGTIFDPIPSTIQGNVYQKGKSNIIALGYFWAAGENRKKMEILLTDPAYVNKINFITQNWVASGGCLEAYPFSIPFRPGGW